MNKAHYETFLELFKNIWKILETDFCVSVCPGILPPVSMYIQTAARDKKKFYSEKEWLESKAKKAIPAWTVAW